MKTTYSKTGKQLNIIKKNKNPSNNNKKVESQQTVRRQKRRSQDPFYKQMMASRKSLARGLLSIPDVRNFARVYVNPFLKLPARLPVWPVTVTQMLATHVSGSGVLNENGIGWVISSAMHGIVNNLPQVTYTSASTAPNTTTWASGTVGTTGAFSNSPYTYDDFIFTPQTTYPTYLGRPVAHGLRVRYTGTELNKSGLVVCGIQPDRFASNAGGIPITEFSQFPVRKQFPNERKFHGLHREIDLEQDFLWQCLFLSDDEMYTWCYGENTKNTSADQWPVYQIYLTGVAGSSFEWEVYSHYEIMGKKLMNPDIVLPQDTKVKTVTSALKKHNMLNTTTEMLAPEGREVQHTENVVDKIYNVGKKIDDVLEWF